MQAKPLETYADGSIKGLLLDFALPLEANQSGTLKTFQNQGAATLRSGISVDENAEAVSVSTPHLAARIDKKTILGFSIVLRSWLRIDACRIGRYG